MNTKKAKVQGGRTGVTLRRKILELTGRNLNENSLITKRRHIIEEMRRKNSQEDIDALRSTLWTNGVQKEPINKKQDNQVSSQPTRESIDGFDIWQSELRIDQRLVMCKVCSKDGYMMREVRQETMKYYDLNEGENLCRLCYHKWYNKCVRMRRKKEFSEGSDDESIGEDQYSPSSRRSMRKKSRIQSRGTNLPESYNVLMKELMNEEFAKPFNEPVDPVALHLPDYMDIIHYPMDLGTVLKKLQNNEFGSSEDFADHVRLVFSNTFKYNRADSPICKMASKMLSSFETKFIDLLSREETHYL